ncbi:MAG: hypothetical protein ACR2P2_12420 [Nakamurella sp.]
MDNSLAATAVHGNSDTTILGDPQLLILDEPWSGLDVGAHQVLAEIVAETRARGGSVVCTDHRVEHVRRHADDVYLMTDDRIVVDAGPTAPQGIPAGPLPPRRVRIVLMGTAAVAMAGEPGVLTAGVDAGGPLGCGSGRRQESGQGSRPAMPVRPALSPHGRAIDRQEPENELKMPGRFARTRACGCTVEFGARESIAAPSKGDHP